ncbi:MAG: TerB family tellurite resistance protein [Polaromonas sp.]|uniref:tellurite resistance TerB family protein n=1 Tax=Polaromonas sp. TaxID=1869339 RepID=UPI00273238E4|nr:TerB family tellurite resistance protein [Polaromonas sp.]MDP2818664.1 TerB family tellurite resistance protein [Polaromonas sp.]
MRRRKPRSTSPAGSITAALSCASACTSLGSLREKFALADDKIARLLELAEETAKTTHDYRRFTTTLNEHSIHPQKIEVIENMRRVAYADAHLDARKNRLISKVAGLLHVTHSEYIGAKMRAKENAAPA